MDLLTHVPGSPASCAETARALRRLAHALAAADRVAQRHQRLPAGDFAGASADSFRRASAELAGRLERFGPDVERLASALARYADRLGEVQEAMRRVRRIARGHGLLHGTRVHLPPAARPRQRRIFQALVPIVAAAWTVLAEAEDQLRAAVDRLDPTIRTHPLVTAHPGTAVPPPLAGAGPAGPTRWPPPEDAWPSAQPSPRHLGGGSVHHTPAVSLAVPRRWSTLKQPAPGVGLLARAPAPAPSGFTPELTLHSGPVDDVSSLEQWRSEAMARLAAQLEALEVEDADVIDLDGEPVAYHRFSHRLGDVDLVCDQWAWLHDGVGVTLTGTVARADYADYCDLFEDVAATVELVPRAVA